MKKKNKLKCVLALLITITAYIIYSCSVMDYEVSELTFPLNLRTTENDKKVTVTENSPLAKALKLWLKNNRYGWTPSIISYVPRFAIYSGNFSLVAVPHCRCRSTRENKQVCRCRENFLIVLNYSTSTGKLSCQQTKRVDGDIDLIQELLIEFDIVSDEYALDDFETENIKLNPPNLDLNHTNNKQIRLVNTQMNVEIKRALTLFMTSDKITLKKLDCQEMSIDDLITLLMAKVNLYQSKPKEQDEAFIKTILRHQQCPVVKSRLTFCYNDQVSDKNLTVLDIWCALAQKYQLILLLYYSDKTDRIVPILRKQENSLPGFTYLGFVE